MSIAPESPASAECRTVLGGGEIVTLPDRSVGQFLAQMPLPGVVIFVHGVNSDGEWYEQAEEGLCKGLNARLARKDEQLTYRGVAAGQMASVKYSPELTADGFLAPKRNAKSFISPGEHYSPVIRFRWGYKAGLKDLRDWGDNIYLNEQNYWGGGPFANGCSTLADLWGEGLNSTLFVWVTAQHFNPVPGREVYSCPPRAYYVHAALRLARLVLSIRQRQADCPVTIVCHSQGNMIGMAAAFLGERLGAVADTYILANAPYSLLDDNFMENWSQGSARDGEGRSGRQTKRARVATLSAFFDLMRSRSGHGQTDASIDERMANVAPLDGGDGFTAQCDRRNYGQHGSTVGRVIGYCNPHDQVISASPVQGIGWLGLSADQIQLTRGAGVYQQRVFAQGWPIGTKGAELFQYWPYSKSLNETRQTPDAGFWFPPSPHARFSMRQGVTANDTVVGKFVTIGSSVLLVPFAFLARSRVSADPPDKWEIPIEAPPLPEPFTPRSFRYGQASDAFDEAHDPEAAARNATKENRSPDDPYDAYQARLDAEGCPRDAPLGDEQTEAQLRYEHRARLRMQARREGRAKRDGSVPGEASPDGGDEDYRRLRNERITQFLSESVDQNATDHSTIMTNPEHAEKALAYDVAVGLCQLTPDDWYQLRVEADWRYIGELVDEGHPHRYLGEYFEDAKMERQPLHEWIKSGEASRPTSIIDERTIVSLGARTDY